MCSNYNKPANVPANIAPNTKYPAAPPIFTAPLVDEGEGEGEGDCVAVLVGSSVLVDVVEGCSDLG